jgi:hypothetical protein
MIKNNDRWEEADIAGMVDYCVCAGVSASMTESSRKTFDSWMRARTAVEPKCSYPSEATVIFF